MSINFLPSSFQRGGGFNFLLRAPFRSQETRAKVPRLEKSFNGVNVEELTGILKLNDDVGHRRSQRQRRTVGEKAVRVSSDMTLKDLKLQVSLTIPLFFLSLSLERVKANLKCVL